MPIPRVDFDVEFFEERAAIREFCAGMSRSDARIAALADVVAWQASVAERGLTAALPDDGGMNGNL